MVAPRAHGHDQGGGPRSVAAARRAALALLLLAAMLAGAADVAHAIPLKVKDLTFTSSITISNAVDSISMERVAITNGASVVMDVAGMLPGAVTVTLEDCTCNGGSQIYILGYKSGSVPTSRSLTVHVSGMWASSCSFVIAYQLPNSTTVLIENSTLATNGLIAFPAVSEMSASGEATAPALALYGVSLSGGGWVRVVNTTLSSAVAGGTAVYIGGAVSLEGSALIFDMSHLLAPVGTSAYALYTSPLGSLSLSLGSVVSMTECVLVSGGTGMSLGPNLLVSASVVRLIKVRGSVSSVVLEAGGSLVTDGWLVLNSVSAGTKTSSVASLSGMTVSGGRVSMVRCITAGTKLATGPTSTDTLPLVQCNRVAGHQLATVLEYQEAGLSVATVMSCDSCEESISCYGPLTTSFQDCTCGCATQGVGAQCLPLSAPMPFISSGGSATCMTGTTVTTSMTVGAGVDAACFRNVVFSGALTVTVDITNMDSFAESLKITFTDCVLDGGAMITVIGTTDSGALLPRVEMLVLNMTSVEGTIAFRDSLPTGSSVRVENSTLFSSSAMSQFRATTFGETGQRYGPVIALSGMRLDNMQFVITRTSMECAGATGFNCAVIVVEYNLLLNEMSGFYLDNIRMSCPYRCINFLSSSLTIDGGSVASFQNSTWRGATSERAVAVTSLLVTRGSAFLIHHNELAVPYAFIYCTSSLIIESGSWFSLNGNKMTTYYGILGSYFSFLIRTSSVLSYFDNSLTFGAYATSLGYFLYYSPTVDTTSKVYAGCSYRNEILQSSYSNVCLDTVEQSYGCGVCTHVKAAVCFDALATGKKDCECTCAAGGHGPLCLPAAVPDGLGPESDTDGSPVNPIPNCIYGGNISSVSLKKTEAGICYVDATFTTAVTLDLSYLSPKAELYNITLVNCTTSLGLIIQAVGSAPTYINIASFKTTNYITLSGTLAANSSVYCTDSLFSGSVTYGWQISLASIKNNTLMLFQSITFAQTTAYPYGIAFATSLILSNATIIVDSCTFKYNTVMSVGYAPVRFASYVWILEGSLLVVSNNRATAMSLVYMFYDIQTHTGLSITANNTLTAAASTGGYLYYMYGDLVLDDPGQFRITGNTVNSGSLYTSVSSYDITLGMGSPVLIFADNTVTQSVNPGINIAQGVFQVTADQDQFVALQCNIQDGATMSNSTFPSITVNIDCGVCNEKVSCYGPGTQQVGTGCVCQCKSEVGFGPNCYPYNIPYIEYVPETTPPPPPVDESTTCVNGGTLTDMSELNLWKTTHCYEGVTFSGASSLVRFDFTKMPLHMPITISFINCTFTQSTGIILAGHPAAARSEGVTVTLSKLIFSNGAVVLHLVPPLGSTISITEVTGSQTAIFYLKSGAASISVSYSAVVLYATGCNNCTLLISNVDMALTMGSYYLINTPSGAISLTNYSSWYVQNNRGMGYNRLLYFVNDVKISSNSVLSIVNNTMGSGYALMYLLYDLTASTGSVFRFSGNSGSPTNAGLFSYGAFSALSGSWFDIRGNSVPTAPLLYYSGSYTRLIDSTSAVTFVDNEANAIYASSAATAPPIFSTSTGSQLVMGCLTIAGESVTTAQNLSDRGVTQQTRVAPCLECAIDVNCFQPRTSDSSSGCPCECTTGFGELCLPTITPPAPPPLEPLPPTPPPPDTTTAPPPPTPAYGECIEDTTYPAMEATYGAGVAWLCFRNVTFSGTDTVVKVAVAQLDEEVVTIIFDKCKWGTGALLDVPGGTNSLVKSLTIQIEGSTHFNSGVSFRGTFPSNTNITIHKTTFTVSERFPLGGTTLVQPYPIAFYGGLSLTASRFVVSGCTFNGVLKNGYNMYFDYSGISLRARSLIAVLGNEFMRSSASSFYNSGPMYLYGNSTLVISGNKAVTTQIMYLAYVSSNMYMYDASVVNVESNTVNAVMVMYLWSNLYMYADTNMRVFNNSLLTSDPIGAVLATYYGVTGANATVAVTNNAAAYTPVAGSMYPSSTSGGIYRISYSTSYLSFVDSTFVLKCNTLDDAPATYPTLSERQGVVNRTCSEECQSDEKCVPAFTQSFSPSTCGCTCTAAGSGKDCSPVEIPPVPVLDSNADAACTIGGLVTNPTTTPLIATTMCYVNVVFQADVTVSLSLLGNTQLNVTFVDCTFLGGANLYIVGAQRSANKLDAMVRGTVFGDGSALVVANSFPEGSVITVVDVTFTSVGTPMYSPAFNAAPSACLLFYNISLTGASTLTVARVDVVALFNDARAIAFYSGLKVSGRSAVYLDTLAVETLLADGVVFEDGAVTISDNSVVVLIESNFLLCAHALRISSSLTVGGNSGLELSSNVFARLSSYALYMDGSSVEFNGGSQLLVKDSSCDGAMALLGVAGGALPTLVSSTWSFAGNAVSARALVSMSLVTSSSQLRVACNSAAGKSLLTAADYTEAGFNDQTILLVSACGACDKNTYCHGSGTASTSTSGNGCKCTCSAGAGGDACFGAGPVALPPANGGGAVMPYVLENTVVNEALLIPNRLQSIVLRNVVVSGAQIRLYVPWMAEGAVSVVIENVTLQRGAVLYVLGSSGSGAGSRTVELYMCSLSVVDGALVLAGAFPANSVVTLAGSQFLAVAPVELPYLSGTQATIYAPGIVLSGLSLKQSVLIMYDVQILSVVGNGRAVMAEGAPRALTLDGSGIAMDSFVMGSTTAVFVQGQAVLSGGSVFRFTDAELYCGRGIVFSQGVSAEDSVMVVSGTTARLSAGPLLTISISASFPRSWLSMRDDVTTGGQTVLSLPSGASGLRADGGTLSLYNLQGDGARILEGTVVVGGVDVEYVAGCLYQNGVQLLSFQYSSVGVNVAGGNIISCGVCDDRVSCYAGLTTSIDPKVCRCKCNEGGYGKECLPVYLGTPDACSGVPLVPETTPTETSTQPGHHTPTITFVSLTPTEVPPETPPLTPSVPDTEVSQTESLPSPNPTITPPPTKPTDTETPDPVLPTTTAPDSWPTPTPPLPPTVTTTTTIVVPMAPCPALRIRVSGTATDQLTMNDIRDTSNSIPLVMLASLPEEYQWTTDPDLNAYLVISSHSTSQRTGINGPWGNLLSRSLWTRASATTVQVELPRSGDYFISVNEELRVSAAPSAINGGCEGVAAGLLTIESSVMPGVENALYGINAAVATVTAAVVLFTGGLGSILEIQTLGVFAQMSCASAYERDTAKVLTYFLSFFAYHGPLWMMVGNACIAIAFGLVHYAVVLGVQRVRGMSRQDAFATVLFPSLTYLVAYLMHLGIFVSSVFMLALPSPKGQHYAFGIVGVLYGVAFPFGVYYVLSRHAALNFVKYWQFSKKPFYVRWLYPIGYWNPPARQRMYGSAITNMKGRYLLWCVFPLVVLCVVGIIAAVRPPEDQCHVPYFCMAAVLLAAAVVVAATNMMRSGFLTAMQTASFVLLAVLCVINAANSLTPSKAGLNAYTTFELLLMVLLLGSAVYSFAIGFAEIRYWQTLREPKKGNLETLLNAEGYSDADGVESSRQEDDSVMDGKPLHLLRDDEDEDYQDEGENAEEGVEGEEEAVDPLADVGEQEPEDSGADLLAGDELAVIADDSAAPEDLDEDML